jgi:hypothetical protein
MPYRDPEARRANWHKNAERNKARQRAAYARHRAARLAAKKAAYDAAPDEARARIRADYAKHKDSRVAAARAYRQNNAEQISARAKDRYIANKAVINARRKGYRSKHYAAIYARIQRWRRDNPERELLYHAKRLLNEAVGIPIRDIPEDLAEAKVLQIKLHRMLRDSDEHPKGEDANAASFTTARAEGIAPSNSGSSQ